MSSTAPAVTEPATTPAATADGVTDYAGSLYLPRTEFPMRAGLPEKEPQILARWNAMDLYGRLRAASAGRPKFILHDGPPYANGHIHIGHALNKTLKDLVVRSQQMLGFDSNYVPGWDCHGLPIEWKIEEQYRARGQNKDEVPLLAFRAECRAYAEHWVGVQSQEFQRLGITGDWSRPYLTMSFDAEAQIARELMIFAESGQLYRGSKPVMWSVVERTTLAEAEIEYHEYQSDMVWVAFPVAAGDAALQGAAIVIWTTTPWTIPGNRAISFNRRISYGLYAVTAAERDFGPRPGRRYLLADKLAADVAKQARITFARVGDVPADRLGDITCSHPLAGRSYDFPVPLLEGDHVTDEAGTGFVHTAPGHGREDFDVWMGNGRALAARGIDTTIPTTVDADGAFTAEAPGFTGRRVLTDAGEKGDANEAVIAALIAADRLVARGRLRHQYPHSWRSKKPVIFRNTPQWFIAMDRPVARLGGATLRQASLRAIRETRWVPPQGENRITGMIEAKPDWVVSRQRAWGVPITVFVARRDLPAHGLRAGDLLRDPRVHAAIAASFEAEGGDAWFADGAAARYLRPFGYEPDDFEQVMDVLDVWFDSGSTHSYTLETRPDLKAVRVRDGGRDTVMYLEGSDQHRGWFHSSLIESVGTRGRAPYDVVLTHGFTLDEKGEKMSKSAGNVTAPQEVIASSGADILRLWVASTDYAEDQRVGPTILKTTVESYRKLRNTLRWMLGALAHRIDGDDVPFDDLPALERLMLHRLAELDGQIRQAYAAHDYRRVVSVLSAFLNTELSAFYVDVRKDVLYCDPPSSVVRRAALTVIDRLFDAVVRWLAPILVFTAEEAWLHRHGEDEGRSVHLETFATIPTSWRDDALAARWETVKAVRAVITGALERERAAKRIGASLEAAPVVHMTDPAIRAALAGPGPAIDLAEVAITSAILVTDQPAGEGAFRLDGVPGVAVVVRRADGRRCARSWKYALSVGEDPEFPDVTPRDAQALRELRALGRW